MNEKHANNRKIQEQGMQKNKSTLKSTSQSRRMQSVNEANESLSKYLPSLKVSESFSGFPQVKQISLRPSHPGEGQNTFQIFFIESDFICISWQLNFSGQKTEWRVAGVQGSVSLFYLLPHHKLELYDWILGVEAFGLNNASAVSRDAGSVLYHGKSSGSSIFLSWNFQSCLKNTQGTNLEFTFSLMMKKTFRTSKINTLKALRIGLAVIVKLILQWVCLLKFLKFLLLGRTASAVQETD